ncbi:MAG: tetratricopeptide repeat protein [Acidimicrobiales bacterium]
MIDDKWGQPQTAANQSTIDTWNQSYQQLLHFRGDPIATMAKATATDDCFVMGSVFNGMYRALAGTPPNAPVLQNDLATAEERAVDASERERNHAAALRQMIEGDFTAAARTWDAIVADNPRDLAAAKFVHEVFLHVGDNRERYDSAVAVHRNWGEDEPGFGTVVGHLSFACEEAGDFARAEQLGRQALAIDPQDTWALHSLAHVYESENRYADALALLEGDDVDWHQAELLSTHVWWHLALRYLEAGEHDRALDVFDQEVDAATTPFRLSDLTSLLWRLNLERCDVGDRWDVMADRWSSAVERYTVGFLDVHAAMALGMVAAHPGSESFFEGLSAAHSKGVSENAVNFREVVRPLAEAVRLFAWAGDDPHIIDTVADQLMETLPTANRIGGSNAQREILDRTLAEALLRGSKPERAAAMLNRQLKTQPNASWIHRRLARLAEASGDTATASEHSERAEAPFALLGGS